MKDGRVGSRSTTLAAGLLMGAALWASPAFAADPPPDAPPPSPPPAVPVPEMTPTPPPPPPAVPTQTEVMPATKPETLPPISVGAWTRVGAKIQGADQSKLNDVGLDTAYVELHAGGKIHKNVGVTLNLNGNFNSFAPGGGTVGIMDAIISFDPIDELHIWAGHLLVPVDRSNASGPFFMIPWNYPGFLGPVAGAPKEGPYGRDNGMVVWGDINGGQITYLAGVFDQGNVYTQSPLFSGRLRLALLDKEPGFWGNGSYFGEKDLFTIGVGGQYQKNGSGPDKAWADVNVDVLFEKKLGGGSFVTFEGAYYHFNVADSVAMTPTMPAIINVSDSAYVLAAYATPPVGPGSFQPMARFQWMKVKGSGFDNPWNIDAGVNYLIKGPALRLLATYSHIDFGAATSNAVQLGAQAIFF